MDDYERFVQSLRLDDWKLLDDDDEEFQLSQEDDEDDDDEGQDDTEAQPAATTAPASQRLPIPEWDENFYQQLEEELELLEEEDMTAAVATLLDQPVKMDNNEGKDKEAEEDNQRTPLRDVARGARTVVTSEQQEQLRKLLEGHFQLLMQQAVLAVRSANYQKQRDFMRKDDASPSMYTREHEYELTEILDSAVGMLQDLDQNRKDAIRHFIQFEPALSRPNRSLFSQLQQEPSDSSQPGGERRLTRAQFAKRLEEQGGGSELTIFAIPGLNMLKDTFDMIDKSADGSEHSVILNSETVSDVSFGTIPIDFILTFMLSHYRTHRPASMF
jgi:hypothetical protein